MLETETVLDRRKIRRSLSFWRALGIGALALAIGAFSLGPDKFKSLTGTKQIARVAIEGTITESRDQLRMLKEIADADHVAAVLLFVNSPGGTTTGGEALYEGLRAIAKKKPVVAQFGTVAASAGYIVGLASDHIVARGNTITGSVGVIIQWPEFVDMLEKLGIKVNEVKSGPLKASPSPFERLDEPGRQVAQNMVTDGFRWFLTLVEQRRGIKANEVDGLIQGRIFSGREALAAKLVDGIGGEEEAVKWLQEKRSIDKTLKVVDWTPTSVQSYGLTSQISRGLGSMAGEAARAFANNISESTAFNSLRLDGLVSLWHPSEK